MAVTVQLPEALNVGNEGTGAKSHTLTVPSGAVGLLVAAASGTPESFDGTPGNFAPVFGGVAMTQAHAGFGSALYELLDISGRSDDDLEYTVGPWYTDGISVIAVFITSEGGMLLRLDADGNHGHGTPGSVTLDAGGQDGVLGFASAGCADSSAVDDSSISPLHSSSEIGGIWMESGFRWGEGSYREGLSGTPQMGVSVSNSNIDWAFSAALYGENEVIAEVETPWGAEFGFQSGIEVVVATDVNLYAPRWGAVFGFQPGIIVRAGGPRQVALIGGPETPEMTVNGTEGQVLTYHEHEPPTWEAASGGTDDQTAAEVPFTPAGTIAATDVQAALEELDGDIGALVGSDLTSLLIDTSVSGAADVDRADAATHDLTLTDDATLTPVHTTAPTGEAIDLRILIRQDGTGGHTLAWGGTISWVGGAVPTMPTDPDALLTVGLLSVDDAATWLGYVADDDVAGVPATTVTDETTWGITPAVGTDTEYARQDHTHGTPDEPTGGGAGPILISDTPSTPLVFADLIQNEAQDDLVYADT